MKRSPITALLLTVFSLLVPVYGYFLWSKKILPAPASLHGTGIDAMIKYSMVCTGLMLLAGHVVLAVFIWKYSRQDRATIGRVAGKTEWRWALLPLILMTVVAEGGVLVIGLPVWKQLHVTGKPGEAVVIEVVAQQFQWSFRYPGPDGKFGETGLKYATDYDLIGVNRKDPAGKDDLVQTAVLTVPAGKLIHLKMKSKDVIHSLFLPVQRVKQDVVPGMVISTMFTPTKTGKYDILCTELCGLGHYKMRGVLNVLEPAAYEEWLKEEAEE
ncbi:MAG: Alternative cytochrome c oxidase subunit 2 [Verrucomicrobiae bacterium]|nr:Alternative cytochrome c oxidase subunit 2 [Verrucomicrobiae bacterium]